MNNYKILTVDDDIDVLTMLKAILTKEGYEVIAAENKTDAMKVLENNKIDLAILDVMMTTHFEGFELAKELKENAKYTFPILMQTSIDVLTTTKPYVQAMAREFRNDPNYSELQVILVKDIVTGNAGVDYLAEDGKTVWFPVDGFIKKPVDAKVIVPEIKKLLK